MMKVYTIERTDWSLNHSCTCTEFASADIAEALTYYEHQEFINPKKYDECYTLVEWEGSISKELYSKNNWCKTH